VTSYAALTRADPNPLKRWVQGRRLNDALAGLQGGAAPASILDYGGGDGELLRMAAGVWPAARLTCFEPVPALAAEARANLAGLPATVVEAESALQPAAADLVLCTEVFEHLPAAETAAALAAIDRALVPGGRLVIGTPVELWGPALAKGLFRLLRRPADFDGRLSNILAAAGGRPPAPRPVVEISPGRAYFPHHAGFDHRRLLADVAARFKVERVWGSPGGALPLWLNSEVYLLARKEGRA
jgi:SAM-dependent methyltransferase